MQKSFNRLFSEKFLLRKHGPESLSSGSEFEPNAVKLEFRTEKIVDNSGKVLDPAHKFLIWNKSIDDEFKRKSEHLYFVSDKSPLKADNLIRGGNYYNDNGSLKGVTEWATCEMSPKEGDYRVSLWAKRPDGVGFRGPENKDPMSSPSTEILTAYRFTAGKWVKLARRLTALNFDVRGTYPLRWEGMDTKEQSKWKRNAFSGIPITPDAEREYERKGIPFMPNPHRLNKDTPDESEGK